MTSWKLAKISHVTRVNDGTMLASLSLNAVYYIQLFLKKNPVFNGVVPTEVHISLVLLVEHLQEVLLSQSGRAMLRVCQ